MNRTGSRRVIAVVALAILSLITGIISYEHGLIVAHATSNIGLVAYLLPLVPDLALVCGSITLIEAASLKAGRPAVAMATLLVGVGWTIAQNIAAGWAGGAGGMLVAGGVPVIFILSFECLLWILRHPRPQSGTTTDRVTVAEAFRSLLASDSERGLAEKIGVTRDKIRTLKEQYATNEDRVVEVVS